MNIHDQLDGCYVLQFHTSICVQFACCLLATNIQQIERKRRKNEMWQRRTTSSKKKNENEYNNRKLVTTTTTTAKKNTPNIYIHLYWLADRVCCSMTIIKLDGKSHRKIIELRILYYLHDDINTSDMICY